MAEIKSFPNNSSEYVGAEWLMRWFHGRTSGVFGANGNAAVAAVQGEMAVTVSDGLGWLSNSEADGIVWWNDLEKTTGYKLVLPVDMADGVLNRIDRVVVSWQTTNYVALPKIEIIKGINSSLPVAPALTNNAEKRQISLARIEIKAGTTAIAPTMIVDERLDNSVCGIVNETISIDTTDLINKYDYALAEMRKAISEAWSGEIPQGTITQVTYLTLRTTDTWHGDFPVFTDVNVPGIENCTVIVDVDDNLADWEANQEMVEAFCNLLAVQIGGTNARFIFSERPDVDINIKILIVRK